MIDKVDNWLRLSTPDLDNVMTAFDKLSKPQATEFR
jgi:hypothetical protein